MARTVDCRDLAAQIMDVVWTDNLEDEAQGWAAIGMVIGAWGFSRQRPDVDVFLDLVGKVARQEFDRRMSEARKVAN